MCEVSDTRLPAVFEIKQKTMTKYPYGILKKFAPGRYYVNKTIIYLTAQVARRAPNGRL